MFWAIAKFTGAFLELKMLIALSVRLILFDALLFPTILALVFKAELILTLFLADAVSEAPPSLPAISTSNWKGFPLCYFVEYMFKKKGWHYALLSVTIITEAIGS